MKIALTGGTGFIGQSLIREYCDKHEFTVYTPRDDASSLFQDKSVHYVRIDRPDGESKVVFPEIGQCDAAVNLGFARPVPGKPDTLEHYFSSLRSTDSFLQTCAGEGIRNVVHISSRLVYDESLPVPHTETEPLRPTSYYGVAKVAAEMLAGTHVANGSLDVKMLRFAQVIGLDEKRGVIAAFIANAKSGRALQIWGTGTESSHEYLYVRDACSAIMAALAHPRMSGVYNVGSGTMVSALTAAEMLKELAGWNLDIVTMPEKYAPKGMHLMSSGKIANEMNWYPRWTIKRALREMLHE